MVYLDTSALAKWYVNEPGSEAFADWIVEQKEPWISRLTAVELRCLLARRCRAGQLSVDLADRIYATFEEDLAHGHLFLRPLSDGTVEAALGLIVSLDGHALRTLDAIHLSVVRELRAPALATADATMAVAAEELGLEVVRFGG